MIRLMNEPPMLQFVCGKNDPVLIPTYVFDASFSYKFYSELVEKVSICDAVGTALEENLERTESYRSSLWDNAPMLMGVNGSSYVVRDESEYVAFSAESSKEFLETDYLVSADYAAAYVSTLGMASVKEFKAAFKGRGIDVYRCQKRGTGATAKAKSSKVFKVADLHRVFG